MCYAKACAATSLLLVELALGVGALPTAEKSPCRTCQSSECPDQGAPWRNTPRWMGEGEVSSVLPQHCEGSPSSSWTPWFLRSPGAPQEVLQRPHPPPLWFRVPVDRRRAHIAPRSESWTAVQIATPIAAALTVAALAAVLFCCYRRRGTTRTSSGPSARMSRYPKGPSSASSGSSRSRLNAVYGFLPGSRSVRSNEAMRDPSWQIDDGDEEDVWLRASGHAHQPSASSSRSAAPTSVSTPSYFQPQIEEDDEETEDHGYFPVPTHGRSASAASDSALLLQPERKSHHPKSLWDRIVRYTDGLRKSPSYRSGRVRPLRKVERAPLNLDSNSPVEMLSPPSKSTLGGSGASSFGGALGPMTASTSTLPSVPAKTHTVAQDAKDAAEDALARAVEPDEQSVLLISRVPGQDFAIDDTATTTEHSGPLR